MQILIDTELITKLNLTPNEFVLLALLYNDSEDTIEVSNPMLLSLESKGYIKDQPEGIILRKKAIDLFKTNSMPTKLKDLEEFVDKYRNLYPQGVKSGGRLVKGDKQGCLSKLKTFISKYPEYTQSDILDATRAYVDSKRKTNFDKMVCADYFISKDGLSMLASFCEDIKIRGLQADKGNSGVGKMKGI